MSLLERIEKREATVGIVGLGYVGLPLAVAFAEAGFRVKGIDIDAGKVAFINRQVSYIEDITSDMLAALEHPIEATTDFAALTECDTVSICVPTPLQKTGDPDLSYIVAAADAIAQYLHSGMLVVLESTTYPGTTTEIVLPRLAGNGMQLEVGEDFFLCFSPERVDPGRTDWTTRNTPKVIGGVTRRCLEAGRALYSAALDCMVPVSSTEAAEMVKLLENTFRAVNIALANEVLLMCERLGLDVWEIIETAATKPFGFMKFTPGPGIGGHCIPKDPLYLAWKMKTLKYKARFIELADEVNTSMPAYWVHKVQDALNDAGKPLSGSNVLVLGVAYKPNTSDLRESPAIAIIEQLTEKGARVFYHDPYVPHLHYNRIRLSSVESLESAFPQMDCTVIVTDHDDYDWDRVRRDAAVIVDTRNALRRNKQKEPAMGEWVEEMVAVMAGRP